MDGKGAKSTGMNAREDAGATTMDGEGAAPTTQLHAAGFAGVLGAGVAADDLGVADV